MIALSWILLFSSSNSVDISWCRKKTFRVSVYYSPLIGQSFYYRWNFKAETRLNGNGTHGASWRAVFNWMIAAPKNYKFWTKIYFPWLWVGQVEDRWQAIVNAWKRWQKHDRIDIRVGRWSDALAKTLSFGKQTMVWYVCKSTKKLKVGFNMNKFQILNNFFNRTFWSIWQSSGRNDKRTKILQIYLKKLWYFKNKNTTWYFWSKTRTALIKFQKDNWISSHYGYFWPQTRIKLRSILYQKWLLNISNFSHKTNKQTSPKKKLPSSNIVLAKAYTRPKKQEPKKGLIENISSHLENKTSKKDTQILEDLKSISRWLWKKSNPDSVKKLQKFLKQLNYYKWTIDWKYDYKTISAVANFQLEYKIIDSYKHKYAWYFGVKSSEKMKEIITKKFID